MPNITPEMKDMILAAVRFSDWAAGEGLCPDDSGDIEAPEDFLFRYWEKTGHEDIKAMLSHLTAALSVEAGAAPMDALQAAYRRGVDFACEHLNTPDDDYTALWQFVPKAAYDYADKATPPAHPAPAPAVEGWRPMDSLPNEDGLIVEVSRVPDIERWNAARFHRVKADCLHLLRWRPAAPTTQTEGDRP